MTLATRQVRFTPLKLDGVGAPSIAAGYYLVEPSSAYDDGTGRVERIPIQIDISGISVIKDLPVTPLDFAWALKVTGHLVGQRVDTVEYIAVPAGGTVVDFEDLVRINPATLGPATTVSSAVELRLVAVEIAIAAGVAAGGAPAGTGTAGRIKVGDLQDVTATGLALGIAASAAAGRTALAAAPTASPVFTTALTAANPTFTGTVTIPDAALAIADISGLAAALALLAPRDSPTFTGTAVVPTASAAGSPVTKAQLDAVGAPDLTLYALLASPVLTGLPTATTPSPGTSNSTRVATTAFVKAEVGTYTNAIPNSIFRLVWAGSGTPVRPSTRTDIFFDWEGPEPSPPIVTSPATGGMYNGDRRSITAF